MDGVPGLTQDPIAAGGDVPLRVHRPRPRHVLLPPAHRRPARPRPVRVADRRRPRRAGRLRRRVGRRPRRLGRRHRPHPRRGPRRPASVLAATASDGMGGMDHGSMPAWTTAPWAGMGGMTARDAVPPARRRRRRRATRTTWSTAGTADAPVTFTGKPGQRVRLRIVNAGSDTAFRVALGGHRMTVTHTDGFPVVPVPTDALLIGMGERYDVTGHARRRRLPARRAPPRARTGRAWPSSAPAPAARPQPTSGRRELDPAGPARHRPAARPTAVRLADRSTDRDTTWFCGGSMAPYRWTINGKTFADAEPLDGRRGRAGAAAVRQQHDDVPPDAPARAHLRPGAAAGPARTP